MAKLHNHFDLQPETHPPAPHRERVVRLPPELVDFIIDYFHSDRQALASFSLVCKEWLASSRYHLFLTVELDEWNASSFNKLLGSHCTTLPTYIRRIRMTAGTLWLNETIRHISSLPAIHSMEIRFENGFGLWVRTMAVLQSSFNTLVNIKLTNFEFEKLADLIALVCAVPSLQTLSLQGEWVNGDLPPPAQYQPPRNLKSLDLNCPIDSLLSWFLSLPEAPALSSLNLHYIIPVEIPFIAQYLSTLAGSLESLHLSCHDSCRDMTPFATALNLGPNAKLRELELESARSPGNIMTVAPHLLEQIQSHDLEEVVLSFWSKTLDELEVLPWAGVERVLTRPQFARLRALRIRVLIYDERRAELIAYIKEQLAPWYDRGILKFS